MPQKKFESGKKAKHTEYDILSEPVSLKVFQYLDGVDLERATQVCKRWNNIGNLQVVLQKRHNFRLYYQYYGIKNFRREDIELEQANIERAITNRKYLLNLIISWIEKKIINNKDQTSAKQHEKEIQNFIERSVRRGYLKEEKINYTGKNGNARPSFFMKKTKYRDIQSNDGLPELLLKIFNASIKQKPQIITPKEIIHYIYFTVFLFNNGMFEKGLDISKSFKKLGSMSLMHRETITNTKKIISGKKRRLCNRKALNILGVVSLLLPPTLVLSYINYLENDTKISRNIFIANLIAVPIVLIIALILDCFWGGIINNVRKCSDFFGGKELDDKFNERTKLLQEPSVDSVTEENNDDSIIEIEEETALSNFPTYAS